LALLLIAITSNPASADSTTGAVQLSSGYAISQKPSLPQLGLNAAQREQVRKTLLPKHTEVEFKLKTTKAAANFTPTIGAKLPKGVKPGGLPAELTQRIPQLSDYGYSKMKGQILLVNPMTGKIAEIIPETPSSQTTTGQQ
jgi:hypothetical protein